jgi:hypothetical protein
MTFQPFVANVACVNFVLCIPELSCRRMFFFDSFAGLSSKSVADYHGEASYCNTVL